MNKKHISLILIIVCFLTIMVMSLWGKEAELSTSIPVSSIEIYDQDVHQITKLRDDKKTLELTIKTSKDVQEFYYYALAIKVNPDNATDSTLKVVSNGGKNINEITNIDLDTYKSYTSTQDFQIEGVVYYYLIKFNKQDQCLIKISYNESINVEETALQIIFEGYNDGGELEF